MNTFLSVFLVSAIIKSYEKHFMSLSIYKLLTSSLYCECLQMFISKNK